MKVAYWSPVGDATETILLIGSGTLAICGARHLPEWTIYVFAVIAVLALVRIVTQVIGRRRFRRLWKYETSHGLTVIGSRVPPQDYVEKVIDDTIEWLTDSEQFEHRDTNFMLKGVVLEVVDAPLAEWCDLKCPWRDLPWDGNTWLRCGLNPGRKLPSLPHVIFHLLMWKKYGMTDEKEVHESMEDIGFDATG